MITTTRRQVRHLRSVFRRSVLGITHRGLIPPLILRAEGAQLRAQHRYNALAIEHIEPGSYSQREAIALPLDALGDIEGRDDSPVSIEAVAPDRTLVRWLDHAVPQSREYDVLALDAVPPFPEPPPSWVSAPGELLTALVEANETTAEDSTRYSLNCLQLRGTEGEIAATDGRQLLIRSGCCFPWDESLLVRRSPIFACRAIAGIEAVSIARTGTHVALRMGPWTILLEIQAEGRFPVLGNVIPDARGVTSRLRLDPEDAKFLADALDPLPGADELNARHGRPQRQGRRQCEEYRPVAAN
jgi:hypothetical protein